MLIVYTDNAATTEKLETGIHYRRDNAVYIGLKGTKLIRQDDLYKTQLQRLYVIKKNWNLCTCISFSMFYFN